MNNILAILSFLAEHKDEIVQAWLSLLASFATLYFLAKKIIQTTPNTVDDTFWNNYVVPLARWIHMDPWPEIDPVEELMGKGMFRDHAAERRRRILRNLVSRVAARHGIDLHQLTDLEFTTLLDQIEDTAMSGNEFKGPLSGLLEWLLNHPEFVLRIIQAFMLFMDVGPKR